MSIHPLLLDLFPTLVHGVQLIQELSVLHLVLHPESSLLVAHLHLLHSLGDDLALQVSEVLLELLLLLLLVLDLMREVVSNAHLLHLLLAVCVLLLFLVQVEVVLLKLVPNGKGLVWLE